MAEYELSNRVDVRPLVLKTLLTYLELEGLLRQGTPFYAGYRMRPLGDAGFDELFARFDAERAAFLRRVVEAGKQGRVWTTLAPDDVAAALGEDRARIVSALGYLEDQGLVELQPAEARQRYAVLALPADRAALAGELLARFERRERAEIERIQSVLALVTADRCQVQALVAYFGEVRAEPCGHCSHCLSGTAALPPPSPLPDAAAVVDPALARRSARRARRRARAAAAARALPVRPLEPRDDARAALAPRALRRARGARLRRRARALRSRLTGDLAPARGARSCTSRSRSPDSCRWEQRWANPPRRRAPRPTVLVCDDEPVLRMLVRATLDQGNYTVVEACDGDEAIARTRSDHPDLILLDMMMPGRSGSDVLRELRGDPATATTPVIMLTARAQASDREAMNVAGADHYLTKPFSPIGLASLVEEVLGA